MKALELASVNLAQSGSFHLNPGRKKFGPFSGSPGHYNPSFGYNGYPMGRGYGYNNRGGFSGGRGPFGGGKMFARGHGFWN